jgi:hypothetical protein
LKKIIQKRKNTAHIYFLDVGHHIPRIFSFFCFYFFDASYLHHQLKSSKDEEVLTEVALHVDELYTPQALASYDDAERWLKGKSRKRKLSLLL